jgi:hypothetical protein
MSNTITLKIDVRKLDKSRFFEGKEDATGHRPLYADLVLFPKRELGKYGDTHMIVQSKRKDEDIKMPIIGNATERAPGGGGGSYRAPAPAPQHAKPAEPVDDSEIPF